ncbi:hypothetical protein [Streptomyces sp. WM6378]|uniref:hypothetical protein n=1 Tax=Streptomyces sp. WM6378 TaxID=1415557 RepID=UPI00099C24FD|nr:hypothetical protein [Streptomyces sp. WM6378]
MRLLAALAARVVTFPVATGGVIPVSVMTAAPWERVKGKVQPWHRDRLAVIYIRQSTPQQVVDHGESTRLQYGGFSNLTSWRGEGRRRP